MPYTRSAAVHTERRCDARVRSGGADDEGAAGGLDDVGGDGGQFVDSHDAADLGEEALEEPEVA